MREQLIAYFGDQEIWVDAHDEETAQALVDWIDSEIGSHFGSVHRGYPNEDGFWQYITLTNSSGRWHVNAYGDCVNLRRREGYHVIDVEEFPFYTPSTVTHSLPCLDDLI